MAKFKFPLQTVIRHRQIKEDLAQKDFLDAVSVFQQEENKLKKMQNDLHQSFMEAGKFVARGGTQGPALQQVNEFKKLQDIRIEKQKAKVLEKEKIVEERREILRVAAVDTKIIEKYREKKFEDWKFEMNVAEQKEMDEMSILRFDSREQE